MILVDNSTASITGTFTEPTKSQDGSPLTDLAYTVIEYHIGSGPQVQGPHLLATKPTGGGVINSTFIVPAPTGVATTVIADVFAVDLSGNKGPSTATISFVIDRVGPDMPTGFTLA